MRCPKSRTVIIEHDQCKKHEADWAKTLTLQPGACVVFDRGFTDYSWYQKLTHRNITFVTRLKRNANYFRFGNRRRTDSDTIKSDQKVMLKSFTVDYRLVEFEDPENGQTVSIPHQLNVAKSL